MRQTLFLVLACCVVHHATAQFGLVNDNINLHIGSNISLRIDNGNVSNQNNAHIQNEGELYLDGTFTQITGATYTGGSNSWLWLEGGGNQSIVSDAPVSVARLKVDNGNRLVLGNDLNVNTVVDLTNNGKIELGNYDLRVESGATIINYDANNYVVTNGSGRLIQEVGNAPVFFPTGNSQYNPVILQNSGATDEFSIRVVDQVLQSGNTGTAITNNFVDRTWFIEEAVTGGSDATITLQWNDSEELTGFGVSQSAVSHWDGSTWEEGSGFSAATSLGGGLWQQSRSGQSSFSPFSVESSGTTLPIELLSFWAERVQDKAFQLNWRTASEQNSSHFWLQRSTDGVAFENLARVEAAGNSTQVQAYLYLDDAPLLGANYYRLQAVDLDGSFRYSDIIVARLDFTVGLIRLSPNPTSEQLTVQLDPTTPLGGRITVSDLTGRVLLEQPVRSNPEVLQLGALPAGQYSLTLYFTDGRQVSRMVRVQR